MMENLSLLKLVIVISEHLYSPLSEYEMFNGTKREDFKVIMNAHFNLLSTTGEAELLRSFVGRMTNPVKVIWAKFAFNNNL